MKHSSSVAAGLTLVALLLGACGSVDRDDEELVRSVVGTTVLAALEGDGDMTCGAFTQEAANSMLDAVNDYYTAHGRPAGFEDCAHAVDAGQRGASEPGDREVALALARDVEGDTFVRAVEIAGDTAVAIIPEPFPAEVPLERSDREWLITSAGWLVPGAG